MEEMSRSCAWSPKTDLMAMVSNLSLYGVDVPWAFTYPTSLKSTTPPWKMGRSEKKKKRPAHARAEGA